MNTNPPTTKAQRALLRRILTAPYGQLVFSYEKKPVRRDVEKRMIDAGLITRSPYGMFRSMYELTDVGREIAETGA